MLFQSLYAQSWLRDEIFRDPVSQIPIPGIRDRDFLFWARSSRKSRNPGNRDLDLKISKKSRVQNPVNPEIPGIGIWISKSRKNRDKIPGQKSRKSQNSVDRNFFFRDIPGIRDFLSLGIFIRGISSKSGNFYRRDRNFFRRMGYPDK